MVSLAPVTGFNKLQARYYFDAFARGGRGGLTGFSKARAAGLPSLVKGSKSSTVLNQDIEPFYEYDYEPLQDDVFCLEQDLDKSGKFLKVQYEEWSETYTATAFIQGKACDKPPVQEGDRITHKLSKAAATKIKKSAEYLSKHRRGFGAFITLTFTEAERKQIALHDKRGAFVNGFDLTSATIPKELRKTIGGRVTRFMNSLQQRRKEGMKIKLNPEDDNCKKRAFIKGNNKGFDYVWVIENPKKREVIHTKYGASFSEHDNPHIHVLTNWTVKKKNFRGWAYNIEKLWGAGFANIIKIKKPASAAAYMAKAASYIGKGSDGSQGTVRGNRYNISKGARAPAPKTIGLFALQEMAKTIKRGYDLGRENWPEGIYFHQYGLGVKGKKNWWNMAHFFRQQGFEFMTAADFYVTEMNAKIAAYLDKKIKPMFCGIDNELYLDSLLKAAPDMCMDEFEKIYI